MNRRFCLFPRFHYYPSTSRLYLTSFLIHHHSSSSKIKRNGNWLLVMIHSLFYTLWIVPHIQACRHQMTLSSHSTCHSNRNNPVGHHIYSSTYPPPPTLEIELSFRGHIEEDGSIHQHISTNPPCSQLLSGDSHHLLLYVFDDIDD